MDPFDEKKAREEYAFDEKTGKVKVNKDGSAMA